MKPEEVLLTRLPGVWATGVYLLLAFLTEEADAAVTPYSSYYYYNLFWLTTATTTLDPCFIVALVFNI